MKAHFLQHVPFEGLRSIETWLNDRQAELTSTRFFLNERLPDTADLDFVIAGPGPMSVNDEEVLPWLKAEKQFLREVMDLGIPVLGICLGAAHCEQPGRPYLSKSGQGDWLVPSPG